MSQSVGLYQSWIVRHIQLGPISLTVYDASAIVLSHRESTSLS